MKSLRRIAWSLLFRVVRAEAHTLQLRGTDRALRLLYHPDYRQNDYVERVSPCGDSLIQIDTRSYIEWATYVYGAYERGAVNLLQRLAHPGSIVLDVGANIGTFTLPLARAVGPAGTIYAFEPHPRLRARLSMNIAL